MRGLTKRLSASNLGESMDSLVFSRPGTAIGNYSYPDSLSRAGAVGLMAAKLMLTCILTFLS